MTIRAKKMTTAEALISLINDEMLDRRVTFPGEIRKINTAVDGTLTSVDVQPQIKQTVAQEDSLELLYQSLPVLHRVPIVYPHSNQTGFSLTVPIAVGDQVLVAISDRAIDKWQETGQISEPPETATPRAHDLSDAIAIIGLSFDKDNMPGYDFDKICLRNRDKTISICVGTDVVIKSNNSTITVNNTTITIDATNVDIDTTTATISSGSNSITVNGSGTTVTGPFIVNGTSTFTGTMTVNGVDFDQFFSNYSNHYHIAPNGGGATGGPLL